MSKSGYEFAKAVIAKNKAVIEAAKQQDKKEVAKIVRTPARSYKKSNNRSKSSGSNGSSSSNSSKTNSGNVNQGVATQNQGSNAPPGFQAPPPPTNTVYDYVSRDNNTNISDTTIKKIDDAPESPMNNQNVETVNDTLPYYTLITSTRSVDPGVSNPVTKKKIRGTSTTDKAWEQGGKQTTEFAAINLGVVPFVTGTAVAAGGAAAVAGSAKIGLTGAAASAVKWTAGAGVSILAPTISKEVYKTSKIGSEDYNKMKDPMFQNAIDYAKGKYYNQDTDAVGNVFRTIGSWIPGVKQTIQSGDIKKYVTEYYTEKGYSKNEAKRMGELAYNLNWAEGFGDVAGTVGIESSSEILGQKLGAKFLTKVSGNSATKITKSALLSLPIAGFFEGSAEYTKERIMENKPVKIWETNKIGPVTLPGGILGSGLFGSAFATGMGTPIARWSVTKPKASKGLLTAARVMDPYEYPGDIVGGAIVNRGMRKVITPNMNVGNYDVVNFVSNTPNQNNLLNPSNQNTFTYSDVITSITNTTTNTTPNVSPTPTNVPDPVIDPVPDAVTITDTTTDTTPSEVPTPVPTDVPTSFTTPAPVDVPVNVPVTTPIGRLPFFPVSGGGGRGSMGYGGFSLGKFYDFKEFKVPELGALFKSASAPTTTKKKTKKRRSRKKKDPLKELLGDIKI